MKFHGIQLEQGSTVSNLTVVSGTSFPASPDEGELFYRSDADIRVKGLYLYVNGSWDRISSTETLTAPNGTTLPASANPGDLFYLNTNDSAEGLYAYNGSGWVVATAGAYTISGDVTGTIDGGTDALTLATVNSNVGSFGSASQVGTFTVNAKGLVTAAGSTNIVVSSSAVSDFSEAAQDTVGALLTGAGGVTTTYNDGSNSLVIGLSAVPNASLQNSTITIGNTSIALGATSTSLAGLISVTSTSFTGELTGNASTATALQTARVFSATGDATGSSSAFDGTAAASIPLTLAAVNSNVGSFGSASQVGTFTVNAKGLVTAAASTSIAIAASQTTSGTFADARISQSSVTQHQGALVLSASQTTSGTFADARISQSSVTQHQAALSILETQVADGTLLARLAANETVTGSWQYNNPVVVPTPVTGSHATSKDYVDQAIAGLSWKSSVRVATTADITLSGAQTIDGTAVVAGNRVLVKNQTDGTQNGVWVVAAGAWARATDFDAISPIDEINGAAVFVQQGSTLADTAWVQTLSVATVGTDPLSFTQFAGTNTFIAGAGLSLSGNTFNVGTVSSARIVVNTDNIDLASVTQGSGANLVKISLDAYGRVTGNTAVVSGDLTPLLDSTYVNVGGDTMTGDLIMATTGRVRSSGVDLQIEAANSFSLLFNTGGTERARLDANGNLLVGQTTTYVADTYTANHIQGASTSGTSGFTTSIWNTSNFGTDVQLLKSRGASIGTRGLVAVNDTIGQVVFAADDGTVFKPAVSIRADVDATASSGIVPGRLVFNTSDVAGTVVEAMRISSTGNIGIGTQSTTGVRVNVNSGSLGLMMNLNSTAANGGYVVFQTSGTSIGDIGTGAQLIAGGPASTFGLNARTGNSLIFATSQLERARIDGNGNLAVGTNTIGTNERVRIENSTNNTPVYVRIRNGGTDSGAMVVGLQLNSNAGLGGIELNGATNTTNAGVEGLSIYAQTAGAITFANGAGRSERMRITSAGNVGVGTASPLTRLHVATPDTNPLTVTRNSDVTVNGASGVTIDIGALNGTTPVTAGQVGAVLDNPSTSGALYFTTRAAGSLSEKMRISSTGNVGIGTAGPSAPLHVRNTSSVLRLETTSAIGTAGQAYINFDSSEGDAGYVGFGGVANTFDVANRRAGPLRFFANNAEAMRITSAGNIGVGVTPAAWATTEPALQLRAGSVWAYNNGAGNVQIEINNNLYQSSLGTYNLVATATASQYRQTSGDHFWSTVASGSAGATVTPVERMRILNTGNVGIGTSSPGQNLTVAGTFGVETASGTPAGVQLAQSAVAGWQMRIPASVDALAFLSTGSVERVRMTGSGELLVGKTSVSDAVAGTAIYPTGEMRLATAGTAGTNHIAFYRNASATAVGSITSTSTATAYNTTSDRSLKDNIVPAPSATSKVKALQVRSFDWKADGSHVEHGFVAQELNEVEPLAVTQGDTWAIDPSKLVATLTKALQEALKRIEALEARINAS